MKNKIETLELNSPIGQIFIGASEKGICFLHLIHKEETLWEKAYSEKFNTELSPSMGNAFLNQAKDELEEYFSGNRQEFLVSIDLQGTVFQEKVWKELLNVKFGDTRSYLQQAKAFGNEKAIRAIASANGKNPIAIIVPCHRIIGSNGSLTGFAGGLEKKKWLLEFEMRNSGKAIQQTLF